MPIEHFSDAAISSDGRLCLVTDFDLRDENDEGDYFVWSLETETIIWSAAKDDPDNLLLKREAQEGHIKIDTGIAKGNYRVFGIWMDFSLRRSEELNLTLDIDADTVEIVLKDSRNQTEVQRLKYRAFSYDWVFATFCEDFSTIAVIEPYYVTFFKQNP